MISDNFKIDLVRYAYAVVVRDMTRDKFRPYVSGDIAVGSRAWKNGLAFYGLTESTKESIYDLMLCGLMLYSQEWCMRTFKRPYLPFAVSIGDKVRNRILKEFPKYRKTDYPDTIPDRVKLLLKSFPKSVRRELIDSGVLVGQDELAKVRLRGDLK